MGGTERPKVYIPGLVAFCLSSANSLVSGKFLQCAYLQQSAFNPILFHNLLHASGWRSMVLGIPDHLVFGRIAGRAAAKEAREEKK